MDDKYFLTVDTSLMGLSLRLHKEVKGALAVVSSQYFFTNQIAAAKMPTIIADLLAYQGLGIDSLKSIGVSVGPGSFTGIKVGLSFVEGLGAGAPGLETVGVSPLESLAYLHRDTAWFLPATKKQGYLGLWVNEGPHLFIVDIVDGELALVHEGTREPFGLDQLSHKLIKVLLPWSLLEEPLQNLGFNLDIYTIESSAKLVQDAMTCALEEKILRRDLAPRYVRKSAPEELKVKRQYNEV